jgi:hypothetical protein
MKRIILDFKQLYRGNLTPENRGSPRGSPWVSTIMTPANAKGYHQIFSEDLALRARYETLINIGNSPGILPPTVITPHILKPRFPYCVP